MEQNGRNMALQSSYPSYLKIYTLPTCQRRVVIRETMWVNNHPHRIHVWNIYLHCSHKNQLNVGICKYTSAMDPILIYIWVNDIIRIFHPAPKCSGHVWKENLTQAPLIRFRKPVPHRSDLLSKGAASKIPTTSQNPAVCFEKNSGN